MRDARVTHARSKLSEVPTLIAIGLRAIAFDAGATPYRVRDGTCARSVTHDYVKANRCTGAGNRIRTRDLRFTKPLLYQLSYAGQWLRSSGTGAKQRQNSTRNTGSTSRV